ncbi:hypothetical protein ACLB1E_34630 [Escherichia coli]
MLSENQVPESTYNLTLVPLDVPGAMISVTTSLSPSMQAKRETSLDKQNYEEMLASSSQKNWLHRIQNKTIVNKESLIY